MGDGGVLRTAGHLPSCHQGCRQPIRNFSVRVRRMPDRSLPIRPHGDAPPPVVPSSAGAVVPNTPALPWPRLPPPEVVVSIQGSFP